MDISIKQEEVDEWINSLYEDDATFTVPFAGKELVFKKRIPMSVLTAVAKKPVDEQNAELFALLSENPRFSVKQVKRLPQDLILLVMTEMKPYLPTEIGKKS